MNLTRRRFLAVSAGLAGGWGRAHAQDQDGWYAVTSDDGKPVANLRLPVEIYAEVEELPGLIRIGPAAADVTVVEFYDYNCPFCRKAAPDLEALIGADPNLRLGLVNNPVLSPQSREAARIELAVLRHAGAKAAYDFHKRLYAMPGRIDGAKALAAAAEIGLKPDEVARTAATPEIAQMLERQMGVAASLGFSATPSFLIAGAGVLGYPGPRALARIVASVRRCDQIAC
jgi:protein-disulfide isomerase